MSARKYSGGTRHPGKRPGSRAGRKMRGGGGGGGKKGLCEFAIPRAVAALTVLLAQFALASWNARKMGAAR